MKHQIQITWNDLGVVPAAIEMLKRDLDPELARLDPAGHVQFLLALGAEDYIRSRSRGDAVILRTAGEVPDKR